MFNPPKNILITSDENEIQFQKTTIKNKETFYVYKFIKSFCKLGMETEFLEKDLVRNLKNTFVEI